MRWRSGQPREGRVIDAIPDSHPAAMFPCICCGNRLSDGRPVQLLALGPDCDTAREECRQGRWFAALALTVHAECLGTTVQVDPGVCALPAELLAAIADQARTGGHSPINVWLGPPGAGQHIATATTPDHAGEMVRVLNLLRAGTVIVRGPHHVADGVLVYREQHLLGMGASPGWSEAIAHALNAAASSDPQP